MFPKFSKEVRVDGNLRMKILMKESRKLLFNINYYYN